LPPSHIKMSVMSYDEYKKLMEREAFGEAARYAEEQAAAGGGQEEFWLTQQAKAVNREGGHSAALDIARRALDLAPANPFALAAAADALLALKRYQEALEYYEEIADHPRLLRQGRRGVLESLAGLKEWEKILDRVSSWDLPEEQAIPKKVKALRALGRNGEASEYCRRWLELKPHHPPALWESAEIDIEVNGLEAATEKAGRLARIPSLPQIYREIYASLCRRAGRDEDAISAYEAIGARGEQSRIQKKKAFTLAKSGREAEALPMLEELLKREPADRYLHSSYAAACGRIGELERGINFYSKLLTLHPEEKSLYGRIKGLKKRLMEKI
jgi:tetratricopeptide (TPR) repeat protein